MSVIGKPDPVRTNPGTVVPRNSDAGATETACNCAVIRQAARRVTRLYDQALAPYGLRITQYPILALLASGGPVTINLLAERMALDRATLGHNLRPLEARGWLTIAAGADRRSRIVTLTDAGRQHLRSARPAWNAVQRRFEMAFGREDSASLRATMNRLVTLDFSAESDGPASGASAANAQAADPDIAAET